MNKLLDVPKQDVTSVVEEALRINAKKISIEEQDNGEYTVSWE